jgi:uncharacterized Fe-S center protein
MDLMVNDELQLIKILYATMKAKVYFIQAGRDEKIGSLQEKIRALFRKADLGSCIGSNDLVAMKMHFGEEQNETSIPFPYVKPVVDEVKSRSGRPFLTDTCVLYRSIRDNAGGHLRFAHDQGFTIENTGAPVVIADGIVGSDEKKVKIPGQIFKEVSIASAARDANALIVLSHVTGHMVTGFGGALKNLGMGFASRKGKLRQHAVMKPNIAKKYCTGCEICVKNCPSDAITMTDGKATINPETCIGCGECLAVCRFDAVKHDWNRDSSNLQKRMVEHALGTVVGKQDRIGCFNFLVSMTKDCDCLPARQKPILPDLGILAGKDPVALDAASLDLIKKRTGKTLTDCSYPQFDPWIQIRHGEAIGLGTSDYDLIEL